MEGNVEQIFTGQFTCFRRLFGSQPPQLYPCWVLSRNSFFLEAMAGIDVKNGYEVGNWHKSYPLPYCSSLPPVRWPGRNKPVPHLACTVGLEAAVRITCFQVWVCRIFLKGKIGGEGFLLFFVLRLLYKPVWNSWDGSFPSFPLQLPASP